MAETATQDRAAEVAERILSLTYCDGPMRPTFVMRITEALRTYATISAAAEREACAKAAEVDLLEIPGVLVRAEDRFDNGASERTAIRIAARIRARGTKDGGQ